MSTPAFAPAKFPALSRRRFLRQSSAALAAGSLAMPALVRGQNLNHKPNVAIIGSGGRGAASIAGCATENIVALCDVNEANLDKAAEKLLQAKRFVDFRKVFDHAKDFDAVCVSTCEHTHALATMMALKAGKHVCCEKPLTHNIWEARLIREAATKAKVATQMGIQMHANSGRRMAIW